MPLVKHLTRVNQQSSSHDKQPLAELALGTHMTLSCIPKYKPRSRNLEDNVCPSLNTFKSTVSFKTTPN